MYRLIEVWSPKPAWLQLDREERQKFTDDVLAAVGPLMQSGMMVSDAGRVDRGIQGAPSHDYFAIWQYDNPKSAGEFLAALEGAGWNRYFAQVNVAGPSSSLPEILAQQVAL